MTNSRIFFYFCLSFIGGIFLNSFFRISQISILALLILAIFLVAVLWKFKKIVIAGLCLLIFIVGIWRHQEAELRITNNDLRQYNDKEEDITLIGRISQEADVRETKTMLEVKVEDLEGKVLITTNKYPEYQYGDRLEIKGKLKTPPVFEDFNYKDYLVKDGIYSVIYYPEIELIERNQGNFFYTQVLNLKNKLREVIDQNLSPPQSSILGALILGDKKQISQEWKEKLNYAGVRHLTAVSGMHVAILSSVLMSLLIGIGLWRRQAFYFSIILILLFIVITGLQPSAIRAGVMGGLFLLGQHLGRLSQSLRAMFFAAALMLAFNPLLLKLDVGFQLSFLAMVGIIYFLPFFQKWFRNIAHPSQFKNIVTLTFSAQIFTLPILIYNFGYFSLVAPATNILLLPLLPSIMVFGFIFAIAGLIFQPLGWFLSLPVSFPLIYLTKVVGWFSNLSFSAYFLEISWIWLIVSYLLLILITWQLNKRQKLQFLNY